MYDLKATLRYMKELNRNRRYSLVRELYVNAYTRAAALNMRDEPFKKLGYQNQFALMKESTFKKVQSPFMNFMRLMMQLGMLVLIFSMYKILTGLKGGGRGSDLVG